ncbi:MAG TPA: squalene--hopene cyclase, partial [Polyangia bacterium]|nr:squalene--hopene cyclase [Polyangia bacterium]
MTTTEASLPGPSADTVPLTAPLARARLDAAIATACGWLLARQEAAGFWCGELEGDTTLESYMILLEAFFGRRESTKVQDLARVIRDETLPSGGWSQFPGGPPDLSVSCLSYFALKVAGERADTPLMRASRDVILALGGVEGANTYTRYHLALFGQLPWTAVPAIPPEMLFLPRASPFTIYDMSSWSRTIFIPLSILWAKKPVVALPPTSGIEELFRTPDGARSGQASAQSTGGWKRLFTRIDRILKQWERVPGASALRARAIKRAEAWILERLEESDGLSAILPAMAN